MTMTPQRQSKRGARNPRSNRDIQKAGSPFRGGIPQTMRVALKYNAVYAAAALSSGAPNTYTRWCPNDTYDPLYDAGGGQSMFRDQMYALYHWARVTDFKFKVTIFSDSANPAFVALIPKQDNTASTYAVASEQPGAKCGVVTLYHPLTLRINANVDDFLCNMRGTSLTDDSFKQGSTSVLSTQASTNVHLYMYYASPSGTANLLVQYEVEQDAVFSEVIAQAQS